MIGKVMYAISALMAIWKKSWNHSGVGYRKRDQNQESAGARI